jgi:hypothetical protein
MNMSLVVFTPLSLNDENVPLHMKLVPTKQKERRKQQSLQ